jgi:hypothetical protein
MLLCLYLRKSAKSVFIRVLFSCRRPTLASLAGHPLHPQLISFPAGLVVSQWYGGELVYKLGMRVKPATEGGQGPEWKLPGDEKLEQAFTQVEKRFTAAEA